MTDSLSVIINVHNEADTIDKDIRAIQEQILSRFEDCEFIIAEDGSTDGTTQLVANLAAELSAQHLTSPERKGYARALKDAFAAAEKSWVFFADAGGKFDYGDFWKLWEARDGQGLVIGKRSGRSDQFYRKGLTVLYNWLVRLYFGVHLTDADSGFRLFKFSCATEVRRQDWINTSLIGSEMALRVMASGYDVQEVPVSYRLRRGASRGLPLSKIPMVTYRVLRNFPALKKACRGLRRASAPTEPNG